MTVQKHTGDDMPLAHVVPSVYLALGPVLFGLFLYVSRRRKKRWLAAMNAERKRKAEAGFYPFRDGFYCIMRNNGACNSGYIDQSPTE